MVLRRSIPAALAAFAVIVVMPHPAKTAEASKEVRALAKQTVKRSSRRGSRGQAARTVTEAPEAVPLPREKGQGKSDLAALPASPAAPAAGDLAAPSAPPAAATPASPTEPEVTAKVPANPAEARSRLRSYYAVSVLADRCNFPITTKEGNTLDRSVTLLERSLKLTDQQADALYSEVDFSISGKGQGKVCTSDSSEARTFRATLDSLH